MRIEFSVSIFVSEINKLSPTKNFIGLQNCRWTEVRTSKPG